MFVLALAGLACLLVSAAIALFVAFPGRGRPLPDALTSVRPAPRRGSSQGRFAARSRVRRSAQEARS